MTRVSYLQKAKAVLGANSSRVTTLALMGQKWSENCSFAATSSCLKAANMHKCFSCLTVSLWLQRCTTFFFLFATKPILHIFFSIDLEKKNKNKIIWGFAALASHTTDGLWYVQTSTSNVSHLATHQPNLSQTGPQSSPAPRTSSSCKRLHALVPHPPSDQPKNPLHPKVLWNQPALQHPPHIWNAPPAG